MFYPFLWNERIILFPSWKTVKKRDLRIKYLIHQRTLKAHFYIDTIYNMFGSGKDEKKCTEILHEFTAAVIWQHNPSSFVSKKRNSYHAAYSNINNMKVLKKLLLVLLVNGINFTGNSKSQKNGWWSWRYW